MGDHITKVARRKDYTTCVALKLLVLGFDALLNSFFSHPLLLSQPATLNK